jgi:hypothetical protein
MYWRVPAISKMDFTAAKTTTTGVFPSSVQSEEMSMAAVKDMLNELIMNSWSLGNAF